MKYRMWRKSLTVVCGIKWYLVHVHECGLEILETKYTVIERNKRTYEKKATRSNLSKMLKDINSNV